MSHSNPEELPTRSRRGWLAAVLTLAAVGAGQMYAGRPVRALVLNLTSLLLAGMAVGLILRGGAGALTVLGPLAILLVLPVVIAVDAWRSTRQPTKWSRRARWLFVTALVLGSATIPEWYFPLLRTHVGDAFRISSTSMAPTLLVGDHISLAPSNGAEIRRDELLIWSSPNGARLHRLAGLPGDTLQMRGTQLYRNGAVLTEPYARYTAGISDTVRARTWGPLVVPTDSMFVLGDNRDESYDSRYFGFAPLDSVRGQPVRIYFSRAPDDGVRWARIGQAP